MGSFVAILNQTIINVALPEMIRDLNIEYSTGQWLITSYMLVNGVLIPITAYLIERFTTRQLFLVAMLLFGVGTFICGIAPNFSVLLIGRMVQASGAGIIMPLLMIVVLHIYPIHQRGRAMGVIGMVIMVAPAIGPTLSGWILQMFHWRSLFYVVLPIVILDIIIAYFYLKNVTKQTFPKVDIISIITSTLGFGGILFASSSAGSFGWGHLYVKLSLFIGIVALVYFIWRQNKSETPMLDFKVFKYKIFTLTTFINVIISIAMFAGAILVPIYIQDVRGFTTLESGLLLFPGAILMGILSPITGWIFDKFGAKWLAIVGLFIMAITTFEFSNLSDNISYSTLMILYTLRMVGMSMIMMPVTTAGLNQLPEKLYSHGTAMTNTMRQMAGAIGMAFLVTVMTTRSEKHLIEIIGKDDIPVSSPEMESIVNQATTMGINESFLIAAILTVIAFFLAFFIKRVNKYDT